jgi:hypothetical protein
LERSRNAIFAKQEDTVSVSACFLSLSKREMSGADMWKFACNICRTGKRYSDSRMRRTKYRSIGTVAEPHTGTRTKISLVDGNGDSDTLHSEGLASEASPEDASSLPSVWSDSSESDDAAPSEATSRISTSGSACGVAPFV